MNYQKLEEEEEDLAPQTPVPNKTPVPPEEDDHAILLGDKETIAEDDDEMEDAHAEE